VFTLNTTFLTQRTQKDTIPAKDERVVTKEARKKTEERVEREALAHLEQLWGGSGVWITLGKLEKHVTRKNRPPEKAE